MQDYIPQEKDINDHLDTVTVKQFDNNSRFLHVKFKDVDLTDVDDNSFDLADCTTALYIKPESDEDDENVNFVNGTIESAESGIVTFLLPGGVTQNVGRYECEIWIYQGDETNRPVISTKPFTLVVEKSIKNDSAIEATQSMSALDAKIIKVNALEKQVAELVASPAGSGGDVGTEVRNARTGYDGTEYNSLGLAVRTQAENLYNAGLTFVGKFLNYNEWNTYFNASFDRLPTNTFASCNVKLSDGTIANSPPLAADAEYMTGTIITIGREAKSRRANYDTQIFIPQDCEKIWVRKYADNAWSEWKMIGGSYVNTFHQYRADINSAYASYDYLISNVTDDGTFFVSQTDTSSGTIVQRWNDLPASNQNFIITNTQYSTHWILQTAVPSGAVDVTFRRLIPRPDYDAEPRDWVRVSEMDTGKKILAVGDSICRGYRNGEKGFVGDLGLPYQNQGVSGATLSTARTDVTDIPTQLANYRTAHSDYSPDIIIANGGHNDYDNSAPLGDIPTQPAVSIEALNASTVMGGLQKLFLTMIREYPNAQRFFVTTHKIKKNNVYLVTERNSAGYSEQELHDAIVACCKVYNVRVIDIFNDSMLNSFFDEYRSGTNYIYSADDTYGENQAPIASASNNRTDYIDRDGVHPLPRGYLKGYVPLIREAIRTETVKS